MDQRHECVSFALCADDYALAPGVSRGILAAFEAVALTATSVMTTSPWWPDHAGALVPYAERADIGLHLNLTTGAPLGPMTAFAPSGLLPSLGAIAQQVGLGRLPRQEIADEIDRQFTRFEDVLGRAPDHVDGHQHVHVLGPIRRLLVAALQKRGWRPWLRDSGDLPMRILRRRTSLKKALGLAALAHDFRRETIEGGFAVNDGFAGFSPFRETDDYATQFERFLVAPGRQHLVMCHPGFVDEHLRRLDPVVESRERELDFLTSPRFRALLARRSARIVRLSDLLHSSATTSPADRPHNSERGPRRLSSEAPPRAPS